MIRLSNAQSWREVTGGRVTPSVFFRGIIERLKKIKKKTQNCGKRSFFRRDSIFCVGKSLFVLSPLLSSIFGSTPLHTFVAQTFEENLCPYTEIAEKLF